MKAIVFRGERFRVAGEDDIAPLRRLVNAAYRELADLGLNYTATYQDETITRRRIAKGRAFLLDGEDGPRATVLLSKHNEFTGRRTAYVSQLAVAPALKGAGLGALLMDLCEDLARRERFEAIQLDTAKTAAHLVSWYLKRGYRIVGETRWEGKTYESWVFEKTLA